MIADSKFARALIHLSTYPEVLRKLKPLHFAVKKRINNECSEFVISHLNIFVLSRRTVQVVIFVGFFKSFLRKQ